MIISCFTSLSRRFPGLASSASQPFFVERDAYGYAEEKEAMLVEGGVARCRANDSRKIVPSCTSCAILKIRRDVKRTMPEQGSSERGGNDEARGRSHLSLALLKGTYLSTTIEFQDSPDLGNHVNKSAPSITAHNRTPLVLSKTVDCHLLWFMREKENLKRYTVFKTLRS